MISAGALMQYLYDTRKYNADITNIQPYTTGHYMIVYIDTPHFELTETLREKENVEVCFGCLIRQSDGKMERALQFGRTATY